MPICAPKEDRACTNLLVALRPPQLRRDGLITRASRTSVPVLTLWQLQGQPRLSATSLPIPHKPEELGGTRPSASEDAQEGSEKGEARRASVAVDGSEGDSMRSAVKMLRDARFASIPEKVKPPPYSPASYLAKLDRTSAWRCSRLLTCIWQTARLYV